MSDQPISFSPSGPPETILEPEPTALLDALDQALARREGERRDAVSAIVADHPTFLDGWARLGELARDDVEAYAAFRVGYHRGLDRLRQSGWRGTGYVRWRYEPNRGFLRALHGLGQAAGRIGEADEQARCAQFVAQCDPTLDPAEIT